MKCNVRKTWVLLLKERDKVFQELAFLPVSELSLFKKKSALMIANAYTMMTLLKMITMLMVMFIDMVRSMMTVRMMMKIRQRVACQTAVALSSDVNPQKAARACDRFVLVWLSCIIEVARIIWLCMCFM